MCSPSGVVTNVVLMGNPGTGKSTLANCWSGELVFQARAAENGVGVTSGLDERLFKGRRLFMDTPGLADPLARQKAAQAIETAIRSGGRFQILFFCTLTQGRLCPEDFTTMKLVLDAAQGQISQDDFSVIFNMCERKWLSMMQRKNAWPEFMSNVELLFQKKDMPTTQHIYFAPLLDDLDCEENAIAELGPALVAFLEKMPVVAIAGDDVVDMKHAEFEEMQEHLLKAEQARSSAEAKLRHELKIAYGRVLRHKSAWRRLGTVPALDEVVSSLQTLISTAAGQKGLIVDGKTSSGVLGLTAGVCLLTPAAPLGVIYGVVASAVGVATAIADSKVSSDRRAGIESAVNVCKREIEVYNKEVKDLVDAMRDYHHINARFEGFRSQLDSRVTLGGGVHAAGQAVGTGLALVKYRAAFSVLSGVAEFGVTACGKVLGVLAGVVAIAEAVYTAQAEPAHLSKLQTAWAEIHQQRTFVMDANAEIAAGIRGLEAKQLALERHV